MAHIRCNREDHGWPEARSTDSNDNPYVAYAEPLGYGGKSSIICGKEGCTAEGLIWLKRNEYDDWSRNHRDVFELPTASIKVRINPSRVTRYH